MRLTRHVACAALTFALAGCGAPEGDELLVHCTASVTVAMRDVVQRFESEAPEMTIRLNSASSLVLERQLRAGATGDLVVLAASEHLDRLERDDLIQPGSRAALMRNRLALVAKVGRGPNSLEELLEGNARVAVASEGVPAGDYARRFLRSAGVWDRLESRCVDVRDEPAVLQSVLRGAVDAGVVYASSLSPEPELLRELRTDPRWQPPIEYVMAIVARTERLAASDRFRTFLLSPQAQAIFERHGFVPLLRQ